MLPIEIWFEELVQEVNDYRYEDGCKLLDKLKKADSMITGVHYLVGTGDSIREQLIVKDGSPEGRFEKYPAIVLLLPVPQSTPANGYDLVVNPRFAIAYHTGQDKTVEARYSESFKPILYPIYDALIKRMLQPGEARPTIIARTESNLNIRKMDRYDIGRAPFLNIDGMAADYIDAIEITDCQLTLQFQTNCNNC